MAEIIGDLVPLIEQATAGFVPTAEDAAEAVTGRACLLDGSLDPCWSYAFYAE